MSISYDAYCSEADKKAHHDINFYKYEEERKLPVIFYYSPSPAGRFKNRPSLDSQDLRQIWSTGVTLSNDLFI